MPMRDPRIPGIVKDERLRALLSRAELARLSRVSRSTIWRIEQKRAAPHAWTFMRILNAIQEVAPTPPRPLTKAEIEAVDRFVAHSRRIYPGER